MRNPLPLLVALAPAGATGSLHATKREGRRTHAPAAKPRLFGGADRQFRRIGLRPITEFPAETRAALDTRQ